MSEPKMTARCECGSAFRVGAKYAGKRIACPNCANPISIPASAGPPPVRRPRDDDRWADDDFDDAPLPSRSGRGSARKGTSKPKNKSGWSTATIVLTVLGGGVFLLFAACAGLAYVGFGNLKNATVYEDQPDFGEPTDLFPVEKIPVPSFANATVGKSTVPGLARYREVRLNAGDKKNAGFEMRLRICLPEGQHANKSLPCVFVAPAGTNMMVGSDIGASDYHDETIPYVQAGMIAVAYSLDGACDMQSMTDQQLREGYLKFRAACAGVVNARNAMEYVLAKVPEVDANRLYCAGHSSAANVSLLFAVHEPRIKACVAYCPAADVESELAEVANDPAASLMLPGVADFLKQSSPLTHAAKFRCPVYLLHSRQDLVTNFSTTARLAAEMKNHNVNVTYAEVPTGDHYNSMISGIPEAIKWLQKQN